MASRLIKLFISLLLRGLSAIRIGKRPGTCVVINYHSILPESKARFGKQLDLLLKLATPIPVGDKGPRVNNQARYVMVTVDDVFQSFHINGLPELCRRNIPVMLFPPTGFLGKKSSWNDYGGENKVGEEVVSAHDLKQIARFQNVSFGSHCISHPDLTQLSEAEVRHELQGSKETLEALVEQKINSLSFPYGSFGSRELQLAREAGYRFCFCSTPQTLHSQLQTGLIGRVDVQPTDWEIEFRLKVLGAYGWINRASAWKRRIKSRRATSPQISEPIHG